MSSATKKPVEKAKPAAVVTPEVIESSPAAVAADERRFCSSCSRTKPVLGGVMALCANGTKRWKCADCHARSKAHLASVKKSQ
jgi:ribosomal protein S27AE